METSVSAPDAEPTRPPPSADAPFPDEHANRPREYHGRRTVFVAVAVMGALALALWLGLRDRGGPSAAGDFGLVDLPAALGPAGLDIDARVGALAPDFELETLDGGRFRLSDWRGQPIVLNFWASWCVPCRREVPVLIRLQAQHRQAGLLVVGVNIEEARGAAQGFVDEFGVDYAIPMDFSGEVTREYLRVGPPNTFFITADGVVQQIFVGQGPDEAFVAAVAALLAAEEAP